MNSKLFLRMISLCFVVFLSLSALPVAAQDEPRFDDPNGLFSVPVPTNWTAEAKDGYVVLSDPDDKIFAYLLVIPDTDIAAAADTAWAIVKPDFTFEPQQDQEVPSTPGVDATRLLTQVTPDQTYVYQAIGQTVGDNTYLMLFDAEIIAATQRNAQLQIIASGFTINALTQTDLSGVTALPIDDALIAELEAYITDLMDKLNVPGASVGIVQNGEVVYLNGFGVRELGSDTAVTPQTLMMIGSTTKSLTTLLMAELVDEGVMTWDTPVVDILPTFALKDPDLTKQITVRNLVCACTGVPRRDLEWVFNTNSAESIIESLADYEFFTDFGEAFQYSNQMVATGGYVATLAAGGTYGSLYEDYLNLMQTHVLDPIGMTSSTFSFEAVASSADHATPHGMNLLGDLSPADLSLEYVLTQVAPAGALWSNAEDMSAYILTQMNHGVAPSGDRVVSAENLEVTWEPQVSVSATMQYGLGWLIEDYKGLRLIHHDGLTFGFTTEVAFMPDAGVGIVVLTNGRATSVFNQVVRERLFELVFAQEPASEETIDYIITQTAQARAQTEKALTTELDAEAVAPYLGTFSNELLGDLTLTLTDGVLMLDAGEFTSEIRALADTEGNISYMVFDPPLGGIPLMLGEDAAGKPTITIDIVTDQYVFTPVE